MGDVASMVSDANLHFVVAKDNDDTLAGVIAELLDNSALRAAVGAANRNKVRADYDISQMLVRHLALWQGKTPTP